MIFTYKEPDGWIITVQAGESRLGTVNLAIRESGKFKIVDADGREVGSIDTKLMPPPSQTKFTDDELAKAESCAKECRKCEHNQGITITNGRFPLAGVKCKECGCGLLSFLNSKCPIDQW